jgi:cytoskeletal protein RodZ
MSKLTAIPGALRRPVSRRLRVRRSTALMVVLFIGLGVLWLQVRTPSTSSTAGSRALEQAINSGLKPGESLTITRAATTTTVAPPTSTTQPGTPTTTRVPSTTETVPPGHSTTTAPHLRQEPTTTVGVSATTEPSTDVPSTATTLPRSSTTTSHG